MESSVRFLSRSISVRTAAARRSQHVVNSNDFRKIMTRALSSSYGKSNSADREDWKRQEHEQQQEPQQKTTTRALSSWSGSGGRYDHGEWKLSDIEQQEHQEQQDQDQVETTTKPKNKTVLLRETPRAAKKQKQVNGCNGGDINGHSHAVNGAVNGERTEQQQQNSYAVSNPNSLNHPALHYLKGGTPCDPAPPPFRLANYGEESLYTLVLLRHGESEWNAQNRYTGWCDVNLTKKGEMEARTAGRLLYENGIEIDHAFTSVLKRASFSCNMALNMAKQHWVPITKTWRLNERHYGALQGYNKDSAWHELQLDQELVMQMRRSYDVRPPRMENHHPFWHGNDRRYAKLSPQQLDRSRAESLKDAADRIMPFINSVVTPSMRAGNKCLIVAHANTIRTLIKQIDNISDEDIKGMSIPTGIPLLYRLDKNMKPVDPQCELEFRYMVEPKGYTWATSHSHGFHGVYLGDLERLRDIQIKRDVTNRDWQRIILRNIGKALGWDMDEPYNNKNKKDDNNTDGDTATSDNNNNKNEADEIVSVSSSSSSVLGASGPRVLETRQLWWQIHERMQDPEYSNMLLLVKMADDLEVLMYDRKQKFITKQKYVQMINKIHLDLEGSIVEPFVALSDRDDQKERHRRWYENLALDLEEECLIK